MAFCHYHGTRFLRDPASRRLPVSTLFDAQAPGQVSWGLNLFSYLVPASRPRCCRMVRNFLSSCLSRDARGSVSVEDCMNLRPLLLSEFRVAVPDHHNQHSRN